MDRYLTSALFISFDITFSEKHAPNHNPNRLIKDVTRAEVYGFVVPLARKLMDLQEESGMRVKIRLCDTWGFGLSNECAVLPRSVPKQIYTMVHDAGVPKEQLEWHGHNDFYRMIACATSAWLHGCAGINGTLLGMAKEQAIRRLKRSV